MIIFFTGLIIYLIIFPVKRRKKKEIEFNSKPFLDMYKNEEKHFSPIEKIEIVENDKIKLTKVTFR